MTRKTKRSRHERSEARSYRASALQYLESAVQSLEDGRSQAAGALAVLSAIAWADAVAIWIRGEKSSSPDHSDALVLWKEAVGTQAGGGDASRHLARLIDAKTRVTYGGANLTPDEAEGLVLHASRLREFAERLLGG